MSENSSNNSINNIVASSNNLLYNKVNIIDPVDGINYFNNTWSPAKTFNNQYSFTGSGDISTDLSQFTESSAMFKIYHIYGTISNDIVDNISVCSIVFYHRDINCVLVPCCSSTNYFDIVLMSRRYYKMDTITITALNSEFKKIDEPYTIDITIDLYSL